MDDQLIAKLKEIPQGKWLSDAMLREWAVSATEIAGRDGYDVSRMVNALTTFSQSEVGVLTRHFLHETEDPLFRNDFSLLTAEDVYKTKLLKVGPSTANAQNKRERFFKQDLVQLYMQDSFKSGKRIELCNHSYASSQNNGMKYSWMRPLPCDFVLIDDELYLLYIKMPKETSANKLLNSELPFSSECAYQYAISFMEENGITNKEELKGVIEASYIYESHSFVEKHSYRNQDLMKATIQAAQKYWKDFCENKRPSPWRENDKVTLYPSLAHDNIEIIRQLTIATALTSYAKSLTDSHKQNLINSLSIPMDGRDSAVIPFGAIEVHATRNTEFNVKLAIDKCIELGGDITNFIVPPEKTEPKYNEEALVGFIKARYNNEDVAEQFVNSLYTDNGLSISAVQTKKKHGDQARLLAGAKELLANELPTVLESVVSRYTNVDALWTAPHLKAGVEERKAKESFNAGKNTGPISEVNKIRILNW